MTLSIFFLTEACIANLIISLKEFIYGGSLAFQLKRVHHFEEKYVKFCSAQIVSAIDFLQQNQQVTL